MNEKAALILDNILGRRSIREYREKDIPKEALELIVKAGDSAPSAGNLKSREFTLLDKKEDIDFVLKRTFSNLINNHKALFGNAPLLILLCADISKCRREYRRGKLYAIQDATLAGQNMMLMAHALGIGSCWIGQFKEKKLNDKFKIRAGLKLIGIISFGYPLRHLKN